MSIDDEILLPTKSVNSLMDNFIVELAYNSSSASLLTKDCDLF